MREEISDIIRTLNKRIAVGFDNIPSKLVLLGSKIILGSLSDLINESLIKKAHFPTAQKAGCITPASNSEIFLREGDRQGILFRSYSQRF